MADPQWLSAALEEYKSLRTESLTAMANQQSTLRYGTTAVGITLGLAMNAQQAEARFWAFSCLIPVLALVFFALYAIEFGRMVRVGRYIDALEAKINLLFPDMPHPLGWEKWLDTSVSGIRPRLPYYWAAPIMFLAATTFSSITAYVFRAGGPFCPQWNVLLLVAAWVIIVALIVHIMFTLRSLRGHYDKYFTV